MDEGILMKLNLDITVNPGPNAYFVAEVGVQKNAEVYGGKPWWHVSVGWWFLKKPLWKEWFWSYQNSTDYGWKTWEIMVLGLDLLWERYDGKGVNY